jgi:hypothetical protein
MMCVGGVVLALMMEGGAQSPAAPQADPRVGLKGGLTDAAFAAK